MAGVKGRSGGARPGAGRKPGVSRLTKLIQNEVKKMVDRLIADKEFVDQLVDQRAKMHFDAVKKNEYFYILSNGSGKFKIGYTSSLRKRIAVYTNHNPNTKIKFLLQSKHAYKYEAIILGKYSKDGSEWVDLTDSDLLAIADLLYSFEVEYD